MTFRAFRSRSPLTLRGSQWGRLCSWRYLENCQPDTTAVPSQLKCALLASLRVADRSKSCRRLLHWIQSWNHPACVPVPAVKAGTVWLLSVCPRNFTLMYLSFLSASESPPSSGKSALKREVFEQGFVIYVSQREEYVPFDESCILSKNIYQIDWNHLIIVD